MGRSDEINLRHYDDVSLADKCSVTDLVGASVSRLLAERGLTLENIEDKRFYLGHAETRTLMGLPTGT